MYGLYYCFAQITTNVLAMVAEDHVPIIVEILPARSSALVALATAWVVMDALAMVNLI